MNVNVPAIFESAIAAAIISHADVSGEFPRIRTWRSIDTEGRWSPDNDRVLPVIIVTAGTPEPDDQGQRQVTVTVGAATNATDDQSHERIAELESALQEVLDRIETHYEGIPATRQTFDQRIQIETANADFSVHVGGVELGSASEPAIEEGALVIAMQVIIHYSRSDRR